MDDLVFPLALDVTLDSCCLNTVPSPELHNRLNRKTSRDHPQGLQKAVLMYVHITLVLNVLHLIYFLLETTALYRCC